MDLPSAPPSILALADLATPMSIRVAATLSLAEHAGSAGATAEQLASDTGTPAPALRCLLDHLVASTRVVCGRPGDGRDVV
jgi:2,7-dihydroxy-5-methyl-1-naphthoate 7-O-methyltransferase